MATSSPSKPDCPRIILCANAAWNLANFRAGLIKALQDDGFEVIAVAPADSYVDRLIEMGCIWREMPMDSKGTSPSADGALLMRMIGLMRELHPSAFLGFTIKPNIYGSIAAQICGVPTFSNVSGLGTTFIKRNWVTQIVRLLYRLAFSRSTRVFFQNPDDLGLFITERLAPAERTTLLPGSGVDLVRFAPRPRPGRSLDESVFLLIARLLWDKGIGEFVDAARIVKAQRPHARFQIAGPLDAINRTAIPRADIERWVAESVIEYLGPLDDVRDAIAASDCVVLPSYREGAPRTLLEGAAMARATVATDVPGCRHVVRDGETGLLCKVRDADDLARAIDSMIAMGEQRRDAMGTAGRAMVEAEFDEALMIAAYRKALATAGVVARR